MCPRIARGHVRLLVHPIAARCDGARPLARIARGVRLLSGSDYVGRGYHHRGAHLVSSREFSGDRVAFVPSEVVRQAEK